MYSRRNQRGRVASGVVQGHDMVAPHGGSHGAMPTQMMNQAAAAAARQMVAPLPGFHPLASRTSMYNVQNAAAAAAAGNMYPAPQGYAQAAQRAQPLPPMILQQQYPINPPVSYKSIPFYDIKDVLLRPSTLQASTNPNGREVMSTFHFFLSSESANMISMGRDINPAGKADFEYQVQVRFCALDTAAEQEDAFPPGLTVKINNKPVQLPQPPPSNKPNPDAKRPARPLNVTTLVKLCPIVHNVLNITWTPDYSRGGAYVVGVWLVNRLTSSDLLERLRTKGARHADSTRHIIKEKLNEDNDDIATTSLRVSLICPLGKMRMMTPARPLTCTHLQCFDAAIFLQMNEKKPTWTCPVCNKPALYDNLVVDGYFTGVLTSADLPSDCHEIQLLKDGSWTSQTQPDTQTVQAPKASENIQEINDLDSDDDSRDTGVGSEAGSTVHKTSTPNDDRDTDKGSPSGDSGTGGHAPPPPAKLVTVDLTESDDECDKSEPQPKADPASRSSSSEPMQVTSSGKMSPLDPPTYQSPPQNDTSSTNGVQQQPTTTNAISSVIICDSPSPPTRDSSPGNQRPVIATAPPVAPSDVAMRQSPFLPPSMTTASPSPQHVGAPFGAMQPGVANIHDPPYPNYMTSFDNRYLPF
ncbi:E3 SUMO-protein ligase [Nesidiocoris tenuis]|uniref:E3 SUMO-protein ligase n=1 Tax=Nesidiocoris tenuis TaxID=355587 RepID=A0ABN7B626_9HEMI|nr:E3 SUMO-protein ligase [Nesidiocoris tenuis]